MGRLNRKQWNALGKAVDMALDAMARDPYVNQQASMLAEVLLKTVQKKVSDLGQRVTDMPAAAYVFAGLHIMHSLADAAIPFDERERTKRLGEALGKLLESTAEPECSEPAPVVKLENRRQTRKRQPKPEG